MLDSRHGIPSSCSREGRCVQLQMDAARRSTACRRTATATGLLDWQRRRRRHEVLLVEPTDAFSLLRRLLHFDRFLFWVLSSPSAMEEVDGEGQGYDAACDAERDSCDDSSGHRSRFIPEQERRVVHSLGGRSSRSRRRRRCIRAFLFASFVPANVRFCMRNDDAWTHVNERRCR